MTESCGQCRCFFAWGDKDAQPVPVGVCRRYPAEVRKHAAEWCSKFEVRKDEAEQPKAPATESDDAYRERIWLTAGRFTVNQSRIAKGVGEDLDEVGAFYGVSRK